MSLRCASRNLARDQAPRHVPAVLARVHGFVCSSDAAAGRVNRAAGKNGWRPNESRGQNPVLGLRWAREVERPASVLDRSTVPVGGLQVRPSRLHRFSSNLPPCEGAVPPRSHGPPPRRYTRPSWSSSPPFPAGDGQCPRAGSRCSRSSCKCLSHSSDDLIHFAFSSTHPASASKQTDFSGGRRPSIDSERRPSF